MYAMLFMVKLGPGMRAAAEKLADQFSPVIAAQKGFKEMTWFGDEAEGDYCVLSRWESKEDAEAGAESTRPEVEQALRGIAKEEPTNRIFEVYEPKA